MNGEELIKNLIDELDRALDYVIDEYNNGTCNDKYLTDTDILIDDARADIDRYYSNRDDINMVLKKVAVK